MLAFVSRAQKREIEAFLTRIYNSDEELVCLGVLMSAAWILVPSSCVKDSPSAFIIQFGATSHKLFTPIKEVQHSQGSDLALLKINTMSLTTYPCMLVEHGVHQAQRHRVKAAIATTEHNAPRAKLKSFPIKLASKDCYVRDHMCFEANPERYATKRFRSHDMPVFVKVKPTKWALVGFSKEQSIKQSEGEVIVEPISHHAKWLDHLVG